MTSLWSWDLPWGITAFPTVCLLGAPVLLDWSEIPIDSDMKSFRMQHQEFKSTFSSDDLPTSWYIRSSRAFVVIKLNGKLLTHPFSCFLPVYFWFRSFRKILCFCALYCSLCIQKEINSRWILEILFCPSLYSYQSSVERGTRILAKPQQIMCLSSYVEVFLFLIWIIYPLCNKTKSPGQWRMRWMPLAMYQSVNMVQISEGSGGASLLIVFTDFPLLREFYRSTNIYLLCELTEEIFLLCNPSLLFFHM